MPLPPDLAALIVSGNVSFMGQSARFSVMPSGPQGAEIGITFGEYPYLADSAFAIAAAVLEVVVKPIPQPDVEQFGAAASIKSISMPVTANYETAAVGADGFGAAASIKSISMPVTANYAEHEIYDKEQFGVSAGIKSISMRVV